MKKTKKIWFVGLISFCLASNIWVATSVAISKEIKTKVEYVYHFTEKLGGEYEPVLKYKNTYDSDLPPLTVPLVKLESTK